MIKNKEAFIKSVTHKLTDVADRNIRRALYKSGMLVKNEAVQSILRGPHTGALVKKYNPARTHLTSAAGETPASDTGLLASSIASEVVKEGNSFVGQVKAAAEYAKPLEYGTVNMAARPFLRPALTKNKEKILKIFRKEGIIT